LTFIQHFSIISYLMFGFKIQLGNCILSQYPTDFVKCGQLCLLLYMRVHKISKRLSIISNISFCKSSLDSISIANIFQSISNFSSSSSGIVILGIEKRQKNKTLQPTSHYLICIESPVKVNQGQ
jgi:hypothetical protein